MDKNKIIWKTNIPCTLEIQEISARQKKTCFSCYKKPVGRKRLFVKYKSPDGFETNVVYCENCWKDFLQNCEKNLSFLFEQIRQEIAK
jgi:hypothetical protein